MREAECMPTLHAGLRLLSEPATEEEAMREALALAIDEGRDRDAARLLLRLRKLTRRDS
jgi:hypothetical protein